MGIVLLQLRKLVLIGVNLRVVKGRNSGKQRGTVVHATVTYTPQSSICMSYAVEFRPVRFPVIISRAVVRAI